MTSSLMQAVGFSEYGGPEVLRFVEVPRPAPEPRDLLVRVRAVSVNPVDAKVRRGLSTSSPRPGPDGVVVIGWDAAGVVEETGPEVRRFRLGDEVYFAGDIARMGSYAEYAVCDERLVGRKPATLSFEEAAALPLTAITAWEAFLENMGVAEGNGAGRTALILGGAGGVGSIGIQIARRVCSLGVVATASRPESVAFCQKMGADHVVDHSKDLGAQLEAVGVQSVDYVLSCTDRNDFVALAGVLAFGGKICCILPAPVADLSGLFRKRGSVSFEWMFARARSGAEPGRQGMLLDRVAELSERGVLTSTMTRVLDWREVRVAHEVIESGHTVGKIVLQVGR